MAKLNWAGSREGKPFYMVDERPQYIVKDGARFGDPKQIAKWENMGFEIFATDLTGHIYVREF